MLNERSVRRGELKFMNIDDKLNTPKNVKKANNAAAAQSFDDKIRDLKDKMAQRQTEAFERAQRRIAEREYEESLRKIRDKKANNTSPVLKNEDVEPVNSSAKLDTEALENNEEDERISKNIRDTGELVAQIKRSLESDREKTDSTLENQDSDLKVQEGEAEPQKCREPIEQNNEKPKSSSFSGFRYNTSSFVKAPRSYGFSQRFRIPCEPIEGETQLSNEAFDFNEPQPVTEPEEFYLQTDTEDLSQSQIYEDDRSSIPEVHNAPAERYIAVDSADISPYQESEPIPPCENRGTYEHTVRAVVDRVYTPEFDSGYSLYERATEDFDNSAPYNADIGRYNSEALSDELYFNHLSEDEADMEQEPAAYSQMRAEISDEQRGLPYEMLDAHLDAEYAKGAEYPDAFTEQSYDADTYDEPRQEAVAYDKRMLDARLGESERRVYEYRKAYDRIERKKKGADALRRIEYSTEQLNLLRLTVDERASSFALVIMSRRRGYIRKYRKKLDTAVFEYNTAAEQYTSENGVAVTAASELLSREMERGYEYIPLPKINYVQEGDFEQGVREPSVMSASERREMKRERLRDAKLAVKEERRIRKLALHSSSSTYDDAIFNELDTIKKRIDRGCFMIGARVEYDILDLKSKREMLDYSYSVKYSEANDGYRDLSRQIKRLTRLKGRALKAERLELERHYAALIADRDLKKPLKNGKRLKLESLYMRLETLIKEKEAINERLIGLYIGSEAKGDKNKTEGKLARVRKKQAGRAKRRLRADMKIINSKIPLDIKEKLVKCANKIIDTEARIEDAKYRLKKHKLTKPQQKDLRSDIKRCNKILRITRSDLKYFLKKAKKHKEHSKTARSQVLWVLLVLLVAAIGAAAYLFLRSRGILP